MKILILSSGGIRMITLTLGAFRVPGFCKRVCDCDWVLGNSAGALLGFLIAATKNPGALAQLETNVNHSPFHISKLRWLWDIITNQPIVPQKELRDLVHKGLSVVQPEALDEGTVRLFRNLAVGFVEHKDGHSVYTEQTFEAGTYSLADILTVVIGSASIRGVTPNTLSDGGELHVFPLRVYQNLAKHEQKEVLFMSPYPKSEMWAPTERATWNILQMFDCVFYGVMMGHVGEDVAAVVGRSPRILKHCASRAAVYGMECGGSRYLLGCPEDYPAPQSTLSLSLLDEKYLLGTGEMLAGLIVAVTPSINW